MVDGEQKLFLNIENITHYKISIFHFLKNLFVEMKKIIKIKSIFIDYHLIINRF